MDNAEEKWAIFWCDLLSPVICQQIEPEAIDRFLKARDKGEFDFPDGRIGKPSLKMLCREL